MASVAVPVALLAAVLNAAAALAGAWIWWRDGRDGGWFWRLVRLGQLAALVFALVCGVAALTGRSPDDDLFWLYALLPLAVSFVAEQLRALSAQTELDARGLAGAQEVGALPAAEQQAVVAAVLRREMLVMAISCGVCVFLLLRAVSTA